jgi:hypothetical protein
MKIQRRPGQVGSDEHGAGKGGRGRVQTAAQMQQQAQVQVQAQVGRARRRVYGVRAREALHMARAGQTCRRCVPASRLMTARTKPGRQREGAASWLDRDGNSCGRVVECVAFW